MAGVASPYRSLTRETANRRRKVALTPEAPEPALSVVEGFRGVRDLGGVPQCEHPRLENRQTGGTQAPLLLEIEGETAKVSEKMAAAYGKLEAGV